MSTVSRASQRMSRPYDARALRSQAALRAALLTLIEQRPLEQISIRDVTAEAGVSYQVFFRRYGSKQELLEDIASDEVRRLLSLTLPMFEAEQQADSLRAFCAYVDEHRTLWTRLLTGGASAAMRTEFKRIAREIGDTRKQANPWLPRELAAGFVVSGLFEILSWWLSQPADYPIENVVKFIDVLIVRSTVRSIDVELAP